MSQVDPSRPPVGNPATIHLKDGRSYSARVDTLKGAPEAPLPDEELIAKYSRCARDILSPREVERSVNLVLDLEQVRNFRAVMDVICRIRD